MVCHCTDGDREDVWKVIVSERTSGSCPGEDDENKLEGGKKAFSSLVESHEALWVSVSVHVCVHGVCVCVCILRQENLSTVSALMVRGERERRRSFSPTVFIHTTSSLLTNLLSRHSQDLNDP